MTAILVLSLFSIVCLTLVLIFTLSWTLSLLKVEKTNHLKEQQLWNSERRDLLNRVQSQDPFVYQAMTAVQPQFQVLPSNNYVGMSDEDELSRSGGLGPSDWGGEPFADLTEEAKELGLLNE